MMTVRFQNGTAVQFNNAHWLVHGDNATWILKDKKDGQIQAFIQANAGCLVEFVTPCRVYNPVESAKVTPLAEEVRKLREKMRKPKK